jgi:hypothetical protein
VGWYADYKARGEARRKKRDCIHEWNDAGKVGHDGTRALYCPICDNSTQASEVAAKIMLNEVMIRKDYLRNKGSKIINTPCHIVLGGKNERNCTYPLSWTLHDETVLNEMYTKDRLSMSSYERMIALEERRELAMGWKPSRPKGYGK